MVVEVEEDIRDEIKEINRYGLRNYGTRFLGCKLERKERGYVAFVCEFDADTPKEVLDKFFLILPHKLERIEEHLGWRIPEIELKFV